MKTTLAILAILAIVAVGQTAFAQNSPDERVKILPTSTKGVIKLHYALPVDGPLKVTFFNARRDVLGQDDIFERSSTGISKRYNVKKIREDFWIEITSRQHVLIYHIIPGAENNFAAVLEPTSHQFLVRRDN